MTSCIMLVRHGETEWNRQRRYQGRSDSPLTERGIAQAQAIGRLLGVLLPDTASANIVSSPLGRAWCTAKIIRQHLPGLPELRVDDRLRELSLGSRDGLTYREIATRSPGVFDGDGRHEWYFRAPCGERYETLSARLDEWLCAAAEAGPLIVVTHGVVSRVLRGLYAKLSREAALILPVPQDRIFRLAAGKIEEIAVPNQSAEGRG